MSLGTVWFRMIAILWSGYFLLEGFDFGVKYRPTRSTSSNNESRANRSDMGTSLMPQTVTTSSLLRGRSSWRLRRPGRHTMMDRS